MILKSRKAYQLLAIVFIRNFLT